MSQESLALAIDFCLENSIFNANKLIEIANHYQKEQEQASKIKYDLTEITINKELQTLTSTIQTSKINIYENIM